MTLLVPKNVFVIALCMFLGIAGPTLAAPKFSRGTALDGVVVYQDAETPTQFWYIPARVPLTFGQTLTEFNAKYWGVGSKMLTEIGGFNKSVIGGVVSGRAAIDITASQRASVIEEIKKVYGVAAAALLPIPIKNVEVQPVVAKSSLGVADGADFVFPKTVAFGNEFAFTVGTPNSRLFAQFVGQANSKETGIVPDASFAMNIVGEAEFVGDKWEFDCTADLAQVWHDVRKRASASVGWGWFRLGSVEYQSTVQDLIRDKKIQCNFTEGSLDNEKFGRQILELGKQVLSALNDGTGGEFFKFEPNPQAGDVSSGKPAGWWPWTVSLNAAYSEAHFKQEIKWAERVSYTGRFLWKIPSSVILAVSCNSSTKHMFQELGQSEPCITQEKANLLNERVQRETAAKNKRLKQLTDRLTAGEIKPEDYQKIVQIYSTISFDEDLQSLRGTDLGDVGLLERKKMKGMLFVTPLSDSDIRMLELEATKKKN